MSGPALITAFFWIYFINAILLIAHEIDSAYWKEWELFKIPGGLTAFLLLHIPILFGIIFGLVAIEKYPITSYALSFLVCFGGFFAFTIHTIFLKKGRDEFKKPISIILLIAILFISICQSILTILVIL